MNTRRMCRTAVAVCAVPLLTFGGTAAAGAATMAAASHVSAVQQVTPGEILNLVNAERAKAGCPALRMNPLLQRIAQSHADDEERNNFSSHTGSDGSSMESRFAAVGYGYSLAGELISGPGPGTAAAHVQNWLNNAQVKAGVLKCSYVDTGVGVAGDRVVQDFGIPG
ncbi:CAP domain-containing protein [Streptomyces sp. NPDC001443]